MDRDKPKFIKAIIVIIIILILIKDFYLTPHDLHEPVPW